MSSPESPRDPREPHAAPSASDVAATEQRRLRTAAARLALLVAIAAGVIALAPGLGDVRHRLAHVGPGWLALAVTLEVLSSLSYVVLFHPVFCPGIAWRISSRIGMSEVGVSALLPAGGAGGLALGAWVLSRRGMSAQKIAARSVAFFLLSSAANVAALVVFGLGLAFGIFDGPAPLGLTLMPAVLAVTAAVAVLLLPRAAGRRRARHVVPSGRTAVLAARVGVATVAGIQDTRMFLRSGNPLIYLGALGYWAFDNAVLWVCFLALGQAPAVAVIATAYLIGQLGGLLPLPAGIGGIDFGLIGALVLFDVPAADAVAAVVTYRVIQLWVPVLMGAAALSRLRSTLNADADPRAAALT